MKDKRLIKKRLMYTLADYKGIEEYLEKMALEGLFLKKIKGAKLYFEEGKPRALDYNVSLLLPDSIFESVDIEDENEYRQLCIDSGWTYCTSTEAFQVFYKEKDIEAMDILSTPEEEYAVISKGILKAELVNSIMYLLLLVAFLPRLFMYRVDSLITDIGLVNVFVSPVALLLIIVTTSVYRIYWLVVNKKKAKQNLPLTYRNYKSIRMHGLFINTVLAIFMGTLIFAFARSGEIGRVSFIFLIPVTLIIPVVILLKKRIKKRKISRKKAIISVIIAVVVLWGAMMFTLFIGIGFMLNSDDERIDLPPKDISVLRLEDYGIESSDIRIYRQDSKSILIPRYIDYSEFMRKSGDDNRIYDIDTEIFDCISNGIAQHVFDLYIDQEIKRDVKWRDEVEPKRIDPTIWNADEAYSLSNRVFNIIIKKDNRVIRFGSIDKKLVTEDFIRITKEKLDLD